MYGASASGCRARWSSTPDGCTLLGDLHASYQGAHLGAKRASARRPARDHRGHHRTIEAIIDLVEARYLHDLFAVQMVFLILVLYDSFSHTEFPCPDIFPSAGVRALWVRFRAIKQDPRQERPAARGSGDWACLGDVPDTKWSPIKWYVLVASPGLLDIRMFAFGLRSVSAWCRLCYPPTHCVSLVRSDRIGA